MICKNCGVNLASEWVAAPDSIELCHLCYEKNYTLCGDHLTSIRECGCKI